MPVSRKKPLPSIPLTVEDFEAPEFADPVVWRVWQWCRWRSFVNVPTGGFDLDQHLPRLGSCLSLEAAISTLVAADKISVDRVDGRSVVTIVVRKVRPFAKRSPVARPRDALFDAIAELAGSDPVVNGGQIGLTIAALKRADPPYTVADVEKFGRDYLVHCSWCRTPDGVRKPTLGEVSKYISRIRTSSNPAAKIKAVSVADLKDLGLL